MQKKVLILICAVLLFSAFFSGCAKSDPVVTVPTETTSATVFTTAADTASLTEVPATERTSASEPSEAAQGTNQAEYTEAQIDFAELE